MCQSRERLKLQDGYFAPGMVRPVVLKDSVVRDAVACLGGCEPRNDTFPASVSSWRPNISRRLREAAARWCVFAGGHIGSLCQRRRRLRQGSRQFCRGDSGLATAWRMFLICSGLAATLPP